MFLDCCSYGRTSIRLKEGTHQLLKLIEVRKTEWEENVLVVILRSGILILDIMWNLFYNYLLVKNVEGKYKNYEWHTRYEINNIYFS